MDSPNTFTNVFSIDQINTVKNQVYSLKDRWRSAYYFEETVKKWAGGVVPENAKNHAPHLYFLGNALYPMCDNYDLIDYALNDLMLQSFEWFNDIVIHKIKKELEIESIRVFSEMTTPGFHIFTNPSQKKLNFDYHTDTSILSFTDSKDIFSIAVLIDNLADKAHLDYILDSSSHKLYYEYNNLYLWSGYLPHRIGSMDIRKNESRITYQAHMAKYKNDWVLYF